MSTYVHGYSEKETTRLEDQARTLEQILHHDSVFKPGSNVLEAGCGVGAQTSIIAKLNPECEFHSIDISQESLIEAETKIASLNITNVKFERANVFKLPFNENSFDTVFVCFVLEHLNQPETALGELKRVLKPGGQIMVIEGDHGSTFFHPDSNWARKTIQCQIDLMRAQGGNANIGRMLYPLLSQNGFSNVNVRPKMIYADASRPELVEGFTKNTFSAMIEGVRKSVQLNGMMKQEDFEKGVADLYRCAEDDGVFCYTFFKAIGLKQPV